MFSSLRGHVRHPFISTHALSSPVKPNTTARTIAAAAAAATLTFGNTHPHPRAQHTHAMAGDSSSNGAVAQHVDWSALRAYIAGKEAFEAEHGRPAPLTDHEVSAIAILLRPAPRPEPDLGKTNWLGLLNRELQHPFHICYTICHNSFVFRLRSCIYSRLGKQPLPLYPTSIRIPLDLKHQTTFT